MKKILPGFIPLTCILLVSLVFSNHFDILGDVNNDGCIDVLDIIHVVNIIIGANEEPG